MRKFWGGWQVWGLGMVMLLVVVSCARAPVSPTALPQTASRSDEEVLRERAQAYWQARVMQDMQTAFSLEDPLRQKKLSLVGYIRTVGEPGSLYDSKVTTIKIEGDQADVDVDLTYRFAIPPWTNEVMKSTLTDDWQKIDGAWYHVVDFHLIRAGKPRVNMERGAVEYPPAPRAEGASK